MMRINYFFIYENLQEFCSEADNIELDTVTTNTNKYL